MTFCASVANSSTSQAVRGRSRCAPSVPPHLYFVVSAVFHYLGPAFAVLLFRRVDVLGVAWLRIVSAAVIFALWRRPWRARLPQGPPPPPPTKASGGGPAVLYSCFLHRRPRPPPGRRPPI